MERKKVRVGIVGYGSLGQYLVKAINEDPKARQTLELAFVWNRTTQKILGDKENKIPPNLILEDLDKFTEKQVDLIVEVSHPSIILKYGVAFLQHADLFVGSPTAFADQSFETELRKVAAQESGHGLYIPSGALWGAQDIQKMANRGSLRGLTVSMAKHPHSLKLQGVLGEKLKEIPAATEKKEPTVIYEGPVRDLCPLAPQNVNTMACAAMAAHNLGFDVVIGRLVADPTSTAHVIDIEVRGPTSGEECFKVSTTRYNPAAVGAVTGNETYASFLSSLLVAHGRGSGVHFC